MCSLLNLKNFQPVPNAEKLFVLQVMQKADSNSSAGAEVDSEQKAEVTTSSSNDTKPHVVGSQSNGNDFFNTGNIYYKSLPNHSLKSPNLAL